MLVAKAAYGAVDALDAGEEGAAGLGLGGL